jgi:hypothetical protein
MADVSHLEAVATMLPEAQRERFLQMVVRFRSVPEDDEFLQILEAIGFISLVLKEVPMELQRILEGAGPIQESQQGLCNLIKEAVSESIPSYEDLKRMTERLENHEIALAQLLRGESPSKSTSLFPGPLGCFLIILLGILIGILASEFLPTSWP